MENILANQLNKKILDTKKLSLDITALKSNLIKERQRFAREARKNGSIVTKNIFDLYINCISLENEIQTKSQKLVYIYGSGLAVIIKLLEEYEINGDIIIPYLVIKKYIVSLYNDKNVSDYIYIILPYLSSLEFLILNSNVRILRVLVLEGIQKLQLRAIEYNPIQF